MSEIQTVGLLVFEQESLESIGKTSTPSVDIVAVHGLNGDRVKSWTYADPKTEEEVMWLADLLPNHIPNARVMTFGYNSGNTKTITANGIRKEAINLLVALRSERTSDQANRPIVFIGHSLGGVIVKQALCIANTEGIYLSIAARTSCLIFFGTPHRSADISSWQDIIFDIAAASFKNIRPRDHSPNINGAEIAPEQMMEVSEEFYNFAGKYNVLSFYESMGVPLLGSVVVGKYSATLDIASEDKISLERDHLAMPRFSKDGGEVFESLCNKIKQAAAPILDEEYIECLQALSALNPELSLPKASLPHPGTLDWVVSHEIYCKWLSSRVPAILLLKGQSGIGKTVLSSFLRKSLQTASYSLTPAPTIAYFSCDNRDQRRRSVRKLLISLIYQLLFLEPLLFRPVQRLYQLIKDRSIWTSEGLWVIFRAVLLFCPEDSQIICIIDALDECDSSRVEFLSNLIKIGSVTKCTFKVIITSQPHPDICDSLESGFVIDLANETGMQADLDNFIKSGVSELVRKAPFYAGFQQNLVEMLHRSSTTFLMATLILDRMAVPGSRSTPASIKQGLKMQQWDLSLICERILWAIPFGNRPWARNALSWILYAFRPLKVHQLAIALAIGNHSTFDSIDNDISLDIVGDLKRIFGPLIQIQNDDVQLVHKSVRESLLSLMTQNNSDWLEDWYTDECLAHAIIAQSCLTYLSMKEFRDGPPLVEYSHDGSPELAIPQTRKHGLLTYAALYWPAHYRQAADILPSNQEMVVRFLEEKRQVRMWSELYWFLGDARRDRSPSPPLQIASELGLVDVVAALLDKSVEDPATSPMDRMVALSLASQNGHLALVKQLLKAGAAIGPTINNITALHMASEEGHESVVEMLISAGADVSAVDDTKSTPLHLATRNGNLAVVDILVKAMADVNAIDGVGLTPLHLAARSGNTILVKRLLRAGADISPKSGNPTALHMAAEEGHEIVVGILIKAGADVSAADETKRTPLHLASQNGYSAVVKLLLQAGTYEDTVDGAGSTPLHLAARYGQLAVVRELLKSFADMNAVDNTSATPLHLASQGGHKVVVKILIEAGSGIERKTRLGWTPLHSAFLNSDVVELLLKFGADVHALNNLGSGPLTIAAGGGSQRVVEMLLNANADPCANGNDGSTPLHRAAEGGHLAVVRTLLDGHADPWAEVWEGLVEKIPLQLVDTFKHKAVVEELKRAMKYLQREEGKDIEDISHMEQSAYVYRIEGWWEKAERLESQVLEMSVEVFGNENPKTLESMANLASIYKHQERFKEAERLQLQVLEASERVFGGDNLGNLKSVANLASTYREQKRWKEAEELEEKVFKRSVEKFGMEHLATLTSMNELVRIQRQLLRPEEAEILAVEAVKIATGVFGEDHPKTLDSNAGLAAIYWDYGRYDEAESLELQILEKSKRVLGDEDPVTVRRMRSLAVTYGSQDRLEEREKLEFQALKISKRVLGEGHSSTLQLMEDLGDCYYRQERWTDAEEIQLQALENSTKFLGAEHPDTLGKMSELAWTYWSQDRFHEAEKLQLQTLEISKKILGEENIETLNQMDNLARIYQCLGKWTEEEEILVHSGMISEKILGEDHLGTLSRMSKLSCTYWSQGRFTEAEKIEVLALGRLRAVYGEVHADTLEVLGNLVATLFSQKRWAETEVMLLQLLEALKAVNGEKDKDILERMEHLAIVYEHQQRHKEEEDLRMQILELSKKIHGENHPNTLRNITYLESIYRNQGRIEEAQKLVDLKLALELMVSGSDAAVPVT